MPAGLILLNPRAFFYCPPKYSGSCLRGCAEMDTPKTMINFHPDHLAVLKKSGLKDEIIVEAGIHSVCPSDISRILGWEPQGITSALAFPYPFSEGFTHLKVFPPQTDKTGHTVKYLQAKGSGTHLYILPCVEPILKNPKLSREKLRKTND